MNAQAYIRSVHEPGEDPRPSGGRRPLRRHLGLLRRPHLRDGGRRVGIQPHPVHGQAPAGDHEDLVLLEKCKEELGPQQVLVANGLGAV